MAIQNQFCFRRQFTRRKTRDVTLANGNGLNVNCAGIFIPHSALRTPHLQRGVERRSVLNQQPMARRNERDAAAVNQRPFNHARKDVPRFNFTQQTGERGFGIARGEFGGGSEKILWRTAGLFRKPAPIEAVNGFGGNDFVQRLQRPRGLCAGAALIITAQANWFSGRREAKCRAGREGENNCIFFGGQFRERLTEQVEFEI